jgi:hypothetical protein
MYQTQPSKKKNKHRFGGGHRTAIIIPFRDNEGGKRSQQMEQLLEHFRGFMRGCDYKVFVATQTHDGRKFNRGKVLNVGFLEARRQGFDTFIFHDCDLLPMDPLREWYATKPQKRTAIHIAHCWKTRYNNDTYLGGIVSFNAEDFELIDGFPNTFWGWGGEDDELYKRVKRNNMHIKRPTCSQNTIIDLEDKTLEQKMTYLKVHNEKYMMKWETMQAHNALRARKNKPAWWGLRGLKPFNYIQSTQTINNVEFLTIDLTADDFPHNIV